MPEAVVLAGGFGTRLQPLINDIPKAMAPVNGRPFLEYLLDYLKNNGIHKVVLAVGYRHEAIMNHFGSSHRGMLLNYSIEEIPLGTGGALRMAAEICEDENIFVLNGDTFFPIDLNHFKSLHEQRAASVSIALRKVQDVSRYGSVKVDSDQMITAFGEKTDTKQAGFVNGGIYLINRSFYLRQTGEGNFSLEKDFLEKLHASQKFTGFVFNNYFIDIGIPEDYNKAQDEFKNIEY